MMGLRQRATTRNWLAVLVLVASGLVVATQAPTGAQVGCADLDTDDIIGWWKGENNNLARVGPDLQGSVAFDAGLVNRAFDFVGGETVTAPGLPTVSDAVSVEVWVRPQPTSFSQRIMSRWDDATSAQRSYALDIDAFGRVVVWMTDDTSSQFPEVVNASGTNLFDGQWHHIAATWGGGEINVYIDGVVARMQPAQLNTLNPAAETDFALGGGTGVGYVGEMDEPTVWRRALTAPEVAQIHAAGSAGKCAEVLNQEITVDRPLGALVLTQRCGVHNDLPAFSAVDAFPGYPSDIPATPGTTDQVGTSPDIDGLTPGLQADPEFGNYPNPSPATYPTTCGLALGQADLVTTGALAGQFYAVSGFLQEVSVLDTRDVDSGWTVTGTMSPFAAGTATFSGDYLGWTPVMTEDTDAPFPGGYDQVVTPGPEVLPGSGVNSGTGLATGGVLAQALPGEGLGIATLDANLMLLIPVSAPAGDYRGILALTAI